MLREIIISVLFNIIYTAEPVRPEYKSDYTRYGVMKILALMEIGICFTLRAAFKSVCHAALSYSTPGCFFITCAAGTFPFLIFPACFAVQAAIGYVFSIDFYICCIHNYTSFKQLNIHIVKGQQKKSALNLF